MATVNKFLCKTTYFENALEYYADLSLLKSTGRHTRPSFSVLKTYLKTAAIKNVQKQTRKFRSLLRERPVIVAPPSVDVAEVLKNLGKQREQPVAEEAASKTLSVRHLPSCYMKLSKSRLTGSNMWFVYNMCRWYKLLILAFSYHESDSGVQTSGTSLT